MAANVRRGLRKDERLGVTLVFVIAFYVTFLMVTPASRWLDVRRVDIHDANTWQNITIDFDRDINRDFRGAWSVKIAVRDGNGGWTSLCTTPLRHEPYTTDATLPIPVTLEWYAWTEPRCYQLPPGEYRATTVWVIWPGSLAWEREIIRKDEFIIWGEKS